MRARIVGRRVITFISDLLMHRFEKEIQFSFYKKEAKIKKFEC